MKTCKCTNFGMCNRADSGELIKIEDNHSLVCPEPGCGAQLTLVQQGLTPEKKKVLMVAGPVAVLALLALLWPGSSAQNEESTEPELVLSESPAPTEPPPQAASSPQSQAIPPSPLESGTFEKLGSIYFNQDDSEIDAEGIQTMEYIIGRLRSGDFGNEPTILIIGTTSSEGTTEHNTELADARAKRVAGSLQEKGFNNVSHTSSPEVGGPEKDPDPNNPRHNRRAEIHVRRG
jgi:outer membrane protein OmpA-like peptidoglycan-associated protein